MECKGFGAFSFNDYNSFPHGTDQKIINCFMAVDKDNSGYICEGELHSALSSCGHNFNIRTIRFIICSSTKSDSQKIGPREFVHVYNNLMAWKELFLKFDRNRNGLIDGNELRTALNKLGYPVSPKVVTMLTRTYTRDKRTTGITYDKFIECCLIVQGLSCKFKEHESCSGTSTFTYDSFLMAILPFITA